MSALYVEYGDWRKSSAILAKRIRGICGTVSGERNDPDRNVVIAQPQFLTKVSTMTMLEKVLYTAKTHTTGGRDGGSRSDDRRLDIRLSTPGTSGIGTNPEQLLAAGWSACLMSAMKIEAGKLDVESVSFDVRSVVEQSSVLLAARALQPVGKPFLLAF